MPAELRETRSEEGIESRTSFLDGKRVVYQVTTRSPSTEAPLVMIPGWPVSSEMFRPLMRELGEHVKCYALNLPGFGGSETDNRTNHSFSYYADFLNKFRAGVVHSERISLLGYSTGGVLGIVYGDNFQSSLNKLIVFAPPYNGTEHYESNREKKIRFLRLFDLLKSHRTLALPLNNPLVKGRLVDTMVRNTYLERYPRLFFTESGFIEELTEKTKKGLNLKAAVDLAADLSDHDFSDRARRVKTETLVIAAENDKAVSPESLSQLSRLIQGSRYILIPDADHSVGIVEPGRMSHLIVEFLCRQEQKS